MKAILLLLVPPAAGALIGFVTNVIAIKMLFRPLKEIRVFGIRLPFTPGLLPRQRHKLADNIGAMVERELLTPEIIRGRLRREEVMGGIKTSVSRYTEKILQTPLGELLDSAPDSPFRDLGLSLFQSFLSSPVCDELIGVFSESLGEALFAGDGAGRTFRDLAGPGGGEKIVALAEQLAAGEISGGAEKISLALLPAAERMYPQAAELLIRFLNRPDIRREMEEQGRVFLSNAILKLNVFQRLFISTAQYDRTLHERMPEIVDDLIRRLELMLGEDETRGKILRWAQESLCRICASEKNSYVLAAFISRILAAWMDKPLGLLFQDPGAGEIKTIIRDILGRAKNFFRVPPGAPPDSSGPASLFGAFAVRVRERWGGESLAFFLSLEGEKKDALDSLLRDQILRIADEQTAAALGAINVRAMVAERIDSLDMIRVERIVLDVMANQLKWIDVFGAILGFLIGLSQSLFSWLFR
jgi:uncharacterized membrane-anchored protein YjiN (DUF445 family)